VRQRLGPVEGDAFLHENLVLQNFGRTTESWSHRQPPWYYLQTLPLSLLPWTPVILVAMFHALRSAWRDRDAAGSLFAAWFVPGFVLLSFVSSKQGKYLLPLLPPIALVTGLWIDRVAAAHPLRAASRISLSTTAGILLLAGVAISIAPWLPIRVPESMAGAATAAVPGGLALVLGATVALVRLRLHADATRAAVDVAVTTALGGAVLLSAVLPIVNAGKSARPFCDEVARIVGPDAAIAQYGSFRSQYTYYLRRGTPAFTLTMSEGADVTPAEERRLRRASIEETGRELQEFLAAPGRAWVVTPAAYFERFMDAPTRALLDPTPRIRSTIGGDDVVLLVER
jgi:4-amino-4-deoxy-L-arabinose transferase-like glycosyltransferase